VTSSSALKAAVIMILRVRERAKSVVASCRSVKIDVVHVLCAWVINAMKNSF